MRQFREIQENFDREQQKTLDQLQKERRLLDDRERAVNEQQRKMDEDYARMEREAEERSKNLSPIPEDAEAKIIRRMKGRGDIEEEFEDIQFLEEQIRREEKSLKRETRDYTMAKEKLDLTWEQFKSFKQQLDDTAQEKARAKLEEADNEIQIKSNNLEQHKVRIQKLKLRMKEALVTHGLKAASPSGKHKPTSPGALDEQGAVRQGQSPSANGRSLVGQLQKNGGQFQHQRISRIQVPSPSTASSEPSPNRYTSPDRHPIPSSSPVSNRAVRVPHSSPHSSDRDDAVKYLPDDSVSIKSYNTDDYCGLDDAPGPRSPGGKGISKKIADADEV